MHLTILSRSAAIYTTRRIAEAARARRHRVRVLDPMRVEMGLGGSGPELFYGRKPFPRTDAVVPRIAASITRYGLAVVSQMQLLGVPMLNRGDAIAASRDKMQCLQILAANGVGIPHTVMASDSTGLMELAKHVGGAPVIVKLLTSEDKAGVMICESMQSLAAALEAILGLGQDIIVQQYVKGARGRDLRAFVVGGEVVAAVRRKPRVGRFARTLARGAEFEPAELTPPQSRAAVEAARVIGLEVCGVDMLDVKGKPLVFEVNSSPGIKDAEQACGVDVAAAIVRRAEEIASERPRGASRARRGAAAAGR